MVWEEVVFCYIKIQLEVVRHSCLPYPSRNYKYVNFWGFFSSEFENLKNFSVFFIFNFKTGCVSGYAFGCC